MPITNESQVPVQFGKAKKGDRDFRGETRMKNNIISGESKRQSMCAKSS